MDHNDLPKDEKTCNLLSSILVQTVLDAAGRKDNESEFLFDALINVVPYPLVPLVERLGELEGWERKTYSGNLGVEGEQ